jgi:hypothetical protein
VIEGEKGETNTKNKNIEYSKPKDDESGKI